MSEIRSPKLPKLKPRALSEGDAKALLAATEHSRCKRRDRAILRFLLDTGAQASELCSVRLADLDLQTGRVLVMGRAQMMTCRIGPSGAAPGTTGGCDRKAVTWRLQSSLPREASSASAF
ncbi:MAG: tyrosine-type recombinase/integrase [Anaerolineales bacterium]|nr:tyrosine-type recombinase/integrase [Anaerolineales bacterium]